MSITVQRQLALSDLTSSKRGQTGGIERKPERKRKEIYMSWHRTAHRTYRFEQEEERREKKIAIIMYYLLSLTGSASAVRLPSSMAEKPDHWQNVTTAPEDSTTDRTVIPPPPKNFIWRELNRRIVASPLTVSRLSWSSDKVGEWSTPLNAVCNSCT